ncbi:hypothetical protein [Rheinheimera hassiensis]|uniref:hypothetical protein n=1 Tax=Rheinheimera hassiensis TaxID=1193627 RepID=UPI001F069858|nr:hypothetical protein [Rheinheimera hassiensis]
MENHTLDSVKQVVNGYTLKPRFKAVVTAEAHESVKVEIRDNDDGGSLVWLGYSFERGFGSKLLQELRWASH